MRMIAGRLAALAICCIVAFLASPCAAQTNHRGPEGRREGLKTAYLALQNNPQFLEFKAKLEATPHDSALLESFLKFMPLSPLDYLQIDMELRHYEVVVPQLHPGPARPVDGSCTRRPRAASTAMPRSTAS